MSTTDLLHLFCSSLIFVVLGLSFALFCPLTLLVPYTFSCLCALFLCFSNDSHWPGLELLYALKSQSFALVVVITSIVCCRFSGCQGQLAGYWVCLTRVLQESKRQVRPKRVLCSLGENMIGIHPRCRSCAALIITTEDSCRNRRKVDVYGEAGQMQ